MNYLGVIGAPQLVILFVLLGLIPTVIALVDISKSQFPGNNKVMWLAIVLLFHFFGSILYLLVGRGQKLPN